jgi:hypothetical protein
LNDSLHRTALDKLIDIKKGGNNINNLKNNTEDLIKVKI